MSISALVLCGGKSTRMGTDKALRLIAGKPLLAHVLGVLEPLFDDIVLSVGPVARYDEFGKRTVCDELLGVGPLAGLHAGLRAVRHEAALVVACDMPLVNPRIVGLLIDRLHDFDCVVPRVAGEYEPMLAVYRRTCVPAIEAALAAGRRRMIGFLDSVRVCVPDEADLRELEADLASLNNVNTPADFEAARAILEARP